MHLRRAKLPSAFICGLVCPSPPNGLLQVDRRAGINKSLSDFQVISLPERESDGTLFGGRVLSVSLDARRQ